MRGQIVFPACSQAEAQQVQRVVLLEPMATSVLWCSSNWRPCRESYDGPALLVVQRVRSATQSIARHASESPTFTKSIAPPAEKLVLVCPVVLTLCYWLQLRIKATKKKRTRERLGNVRGGTGGGGQGGRSKGVFPPILAHIRKKQGLGLRPSPKNPAADLGKSCLRFTLFGVGALPPL